MAPTRRWLLAAAGLAAISARQTFAPQAFVTDDLAIRGHRLMGLLSGPDSARHIATAYLAGISETNARRAALDLGMRAVLAPMDGIEGMEAARAWLGSRIRADYESGMVIDVDGWRLSRTEVGACLLVSDVT